MKSKPLPSGPRVLHTRDGYDRWAEIYESDGNPLTLLEEPLVEQLMGEVTGLEVLDLGCGTGRHALWLAEAGAQVTALDFSAGMLAVARDKPGAESIHFVEHDLHQPLPFEDARFDRLLSSLVLEHIEDLPLLFREIHRVLKPGGRAVITAMHPAMMLIGVQAGFRDPDSGEKLHPRSLDNQISDFVMGAVKAGLTIEHMSEHRVDEKLAKQAPRAEKYLGWLMLLAMAFLRPT